MSTQTTINLLKVVSQFMKYGNNSIEFQNIIKRTNEKIRFGKFNNSEEVKDFLKNEIGLFFAIRLKNLDNRRNDLVRKNDIFELKKIDKEIGDIMKMQKQILSEGIKKEDVSVKDKLEAQKKYMKKINSPLFSPSNGICFVCRKQIYDKISMHDAANTLISGCPYCHWSFVENINTKEAVIGQKVTVGNFDKEYPAVVTGVKNGKITNARVNQYGLEKDIENDGAKWWIASEFFDSSSARDLDDDISMLKASIAAEQDASTLYDNFAKKAGDEDVKKVFEDVSKEEEEHIGEFEALLNKLDSNYKDNKAEGEKEVDKLIETSEATELTELKEAFEAGKVSDNEFEKRLNILFSQFEDGKLDNNEYEREIKKLREELYGAITVEDLKKCIFDKDWEGVKQIIISKKISSDEMIDLSVLPDIPFDVIEIYNNNYNLDLFEAFKYNKYNSRNLDDVAYSLYGKRFNALNDYQKNDVYYTIDEQDDEFDEKVSNIRKLTSISVNDVIEFRELINREVKSVGKKFNKEKLLEHIYKKFGYIPKRMLEDMTMDAIDDLGGQKIRKYKDKELEGILTTSARSVISRKLFGKEYDELNDEDKVEVDKRI